MNLEDIKKELSKYFDPRIIDEIFKEFVDLKKAYLSKDRIKTGIFGGRFSELVVAAIKGHYEGKKIDLNKIDFDKFSNDLLNLSKKDAKDELLTLNLPLIAKSIYSIRSKRRIAHIKSFDANIFDIDYIFDSCKWIFAQLILVSSNSDEKELYQFIETLLEKELPLVQEFEDGSYLVLNDKLEFKDELLLILYKVSKRLSNDAIRRNLSVDYPSKVTTYLNLLKNRRLVHINEDGSMLTQAGIKYVEDNLIKSYRSK